MLDPNTISFINVLLLSKKSSKITKFFLARLILHLINMKQEIPLQIFLFMYPDSPIRKISFLYFPLFNKLKALNKGTAIIVRFLHWIMGLLNI
jgi:hypothetical protein